MGYIIEKGKIISKDKIPHPPRWFADNRISFQVDEEGIADIDYFNRVSTGHFKAFYKGFWGGLRFYIDDGNSNRLLSFDDCVILPFGIEGNCGAYKLSIFVADDTVFIKLKATSPIKENTVFKAEFYDEYCFNPQGNKVGYNCRVLRVSAHASGQ